MKEKKPRKIGQNLWTFPDTYVVLDIETTGGNSEWDDIIEIGAIKVEEGSKTDEFDELIKVPFPLDPFIIQLTSITDDMLDDAQPIEEVLPKFLEFAGNHTILGHNVTFDLSHISRESERLYGHPFMNDYIDTMRISRKLFPEWPHHRLGDLVYEFDLGDEVKHRALSDVLQTDACYRHMKKYVERYDTPFHLNV